MERFADNFVKVLLLYKIKALETQSLHGAPGMHLHRKIKPLKSGYRGRQLLSGYTRITQFFRQTPDKSLKPQCWKQNSSNRLLKVSKWRHTLGPPNGRQMSSQRTFKKTWRWVCYLAFVNSFFFCFFCFLKKRGSSYQFRHLSPHLRALCEFS